MAELEKTIQGLEHCVEKNDNKDVLCKENDCPYYKPIQANGVRIFCGSLMHDALSLLKAQEPRVMTLEEVKTAEVVWIEQVGECVPAIKIRTVEDGKIMFAYSYEENIHTINIMPKYYGGISRCWTSRPTDEQREATPWEK